MTTLNDVRHLLAEPFPQGVVELKPGATNGDGTKALALAYVDARHYQARLDDVVGADNWQVRYRPVSERATVCRLTVLGITREDVGETEANDPNQATSSAMQAFKRACASFGLGRYLYTDLPQLWVDAEKRGKSVVIKDPHAAVQQMYQRAGIALSKRSQYIGRLHVLIAQMDENSLLALGKELTSKANGNGK